MKYYYLQVGDYIQSDDEVEVSDGWSSISEKWFGRKYGYNLEGERQQWVACRRLVPDECHVKCNTTVEIQEQYGLEFEF